MADQQIYKFSQRLLRWLERMGFDEDPFALHQAEKEGDNLLSFYVDRPYLYDILGDPHYPQTAFLMAKRGQGKTASKEIVAYQCMYGRLRKRALAIHYADFSYLLQQVQGDVRKITTRHHIENLARCILKTLVKDVPATYFELLGDVERALLVSYMRAFADPVSKVKLTRIFQDAPLDINWQDLSSVELLTTLAEIFVHLGQKPERTYQSLYILVDRVDETPAGPEAAGALIEPLITDKILLNAPNIAFKFFLPLEVGQYLHSTVNLRPDRLCTRIIDWDKSALEDVIRQRLIHYSNGKIESLGDLCIAAAKNRVTDRLIDASQGSPRTLLRLCQALIHTHVERTNNALIDTSDIAATLADFFHRIEMIARATPPDHAPELTLAKPDIVPTICPTPDTTKTGLHMDESGHVWVNGEQLKPALTQQEFDLLRALYIRSPNIMTHEELIDIIWPESDWKQDEVYDEQNLRKLVSRLRKRLEPKVSARQSRFLKSVRGRGYWLNKE